jgi:hypothetical protein
MALNITNLSDDLKETSLFLTTMLQCMNLFLLTSYQLLSIHCIDEVYNVSDPQIMPKRLSQVTT